MIVILSKKVILIVSVIVVIGLIVAGSVYYNKPNKNENNGPRIAYPNEVEISISLDNTTLIINESTINITVSVQNKMNETLSLGNEWTFSLKNVDNPEVNFTDTMQIMDAVYTISPMATITVLTMELDTDVLLMNGTFQKEEVTGSYIVEFKYTDNLYASFKYFDVEL